MSKPRQKKTVEQAEDSSPNPSSSACDIRIQKRLAECFAKSFPQKIVLAKPSPHFAPPHCPNTWRAEPRKKNTPCISDLAGVNFLLKKERVFFFRGCRGSARRWRGDTSVRGSFEPPRAPRVRLVGVRVAFKIVSNFV